VRPIKFRAWDLESKIMWCHEELAAADPDGVMSFNSIIGGTSHGMVSMQFTGILDRNGVEVYEGDVLEESDEYLFEVVWDAAWAKFKLQWRTKAIQYPGWNRGKNMAVIGNIHQHPELLNP